MAVASRRRHPGPMTLAVAVALAALAVCPADAFMRLMGGSDNYCGVEGSFCLSSGDCCTGLACFPGFKRMGGGICQRSQQQQQQQQHQEHLAMPSSAEAADVRCQADGDCPAGQCCVRRVVGVRGASISSCQADCSSREADRILDDFYSRYYRRAARGRSHPHEKEMKHHHEAEDDEDKKKKKSHN